MVYSIGEFSELIGISTYTLRYYEKEKLIIPARLENGRRIYAENDIQWILFIKRLKDTGMPVKQISKYAELRAKGNSTFKERREILRNHQICLKEKMILLQEHIANLAQKIEYYDDEINQLI